MSLFWSQQVWTHSRASEGALLVLLALADFADENGFCYPSQTQLETKTRLSARQIRRVCHSLEKLGELEIVEQGNGRGHRTVFRVCVSEKKADISDEKADIMTGFGEKRRTFGTPKGGHLEHLKADICDNPPTPPYKDKQSIRLSEERSRERVREHPPNAPSESDQNTHSQKTRAPVSNVLRFEQPKPQIDSEFLELMQSRFPDLDVRFVYEKLRLAGGDQTKARLLSWLGNERPQIKILEVKNDRNDNRKRNRAANGKSVEPESATDSRAEIERLGFRPAKVI